MKTIKTIYDYNKETHVATCTMIDTDSNLSWRGCATCHPNDLDFESEKTGLWIAEYRALLKVSKAERREVKIKLKEITDFYDSVKDCSSFEAGSYLARKLQARIGALTETLSDIDEDILNIKLTLERGIAAKEGLYQSLRDLRKRRKDA